MHAQVEHGAVRAKSQGEYARHRPEDTVLYRIVERHAPSFFSALGEQGASLPGFVRDEFDAFMRCGRLEHGFIRAKCQACRFEHLVAFSCKLRGFCPSCAARRMADTSSYLLEQVIPPIAMRQWVVSFPWPLRLVFAARPDWLTKVLGIVSRAISSAVIARAGLRRSEGAQTGTITFVQRFGSALNLNVHLHILVPDGAYTFEHGKAHFHRAPAPSPEQLRQLLDTVLARIIGALERGGVLVKEDEQAYFDLPLDSPLEQLSAAAVRYRIALGPQAGRRTMTLRRGGAPSEALLPLDKPFTVARDGLSINCAVSCEPNERGKLERLCRYMTRPAIAQARLSVDGDGLVVYQLKRPFRDGTTHVLFEPHDFIARLAALVPRPRSHLIRYHGLFAPNARHRRLIVKPKAATGDAKDADDAQPTERAPSRWMARLKQVFDIEVRVCPRCGGQLRVIGEVTEPAIIARILEHIRARDGRQRLARGPPTLAS